MNVTSIPAKDIFQYIGRADCKIIDLRNKEDYLRGHIPSAINIPFEAFENNQICLVAGYYYIVYCERGGLSLQLARVLTRQGYKIINVYGGFHAYRGKISVDG
ncbi:rhodanese-like domain-containing protein [Anaeromicropila populeti]|uniref:Rhodanese-related sulfurtransferase n=1 Tax=Anaeromicropila populeti TaxID=37658 RepID=A0A1I6K0Y0_9FIRM|nr:rhodanese-like domain-containing protein [Anaeromicropila populeti]SFR84889.1 Rhodanese-related sulfurtransferase [Anaeromicropila populeti]